MCIGLDEWAGARGNSWESNKEVFWNEREMGGVVVVVVVGGVRLEYGCRNCFGS